MRSPLLALPIVLGSLGLARSSLAAPEAALAPGPGLAAVGVRVDVARPSLLVRACAAPPCAATAEATDLQSVEIPVAPGDMPKEADVTIEKLSLGNGRQALRVRVPIASKGTAWEAIVAGQKPSPVVWSGVTGLSKGDTGDRTGEALVVEDRDGGAKFVLLGDLREDSSICGLPVTLLSPRALDPTTLQWRGITYQRLPKQLRAQATRIVATARGGIAERSLAPLLVATAASTGTAKGLTDGDSTTVWSEGRPGIGQGEFVVLRAPAEVPITRLAVTVAPQTATAEGAAPRSFYLVTPTTTFHVTLPEDGWQHPNDAYDIPLPEPLSTSCITLVLDEAYDHGKAKPDISIAEMHAYSAFDVPNATLESVAAALAGGGARAQAAAGLLKRAGKAGVGPVSAAYASLDVEGRALAMDVAAAAEECAGSTVLVRGLGEKDARIANKARGKLERCGKLAASAFVDALRGPDLAIRARVAPMLASAAPALALEPLAGALDRGTPEMRAVLRSAFARAAESAPVDKLAEILMDAGRPNDARIDVLRASTVRIGDVSAEASGAIAALLVPGATMRTRYLMVAPLAALARAGDEPAEQRYLALLTRDPEWPVRARAAELGEGIAPSALLASLRDPEPRVREAALKGLTPSRVPSATAPGAELLARDPWPFVRVAAANLLAALPTHPGVDQVLASSLVDRSPRVRRAILVALGARRATSHEKSIQLRLDDPNEALEVRVSAARALGEVCGRGATERLTKLALAAGTPTLDDTEIQLAAAAIEALGRLHPPDLSVRLEKLQDPSVRPEVRRTVDAALKETDTCP